MVERDNANHRDLIIWQKGIELTKLIYLATESFPAKEVYGLTSQMRRAAISVPSNIAEGKARATPAEFRHFLRITLGSLAELDTQLVLAGELGYLPPEQVARVETPIKELRKMIFRFSNRLDSN